MLVLINVWRKITICAQLGIAVASSYFNSSCIEPKKTTCDWQCLPTECIQKLIFNQVIII